MATILVADDEPAVLQGITKLLKRAGYDVLTATCGEEAVLTFSVQTVKIDLLIFDVVMPGIGGIEACRRIRQIRPGMPVLFCSAYSDEDPATIGGSPHMLRVLPKPFHITQLLEAVSDMIRGESGLRESKEQAGA